MKMFKTGFYALLLIVGMTFGMSSNIALAGGGSDKQSESMFGITHYIELDPIMLPVIDTHGVSQVVNMVIALEVNSISLVGKAERLQPKLTDAFIQDMYGVMAKQAAVNGGVLELSVIKNRLIKVSNRILADGNNRVEDVLLQMLDQRRI